MEFVLSSSKKNGNFLEQANFEEINYNTELFNMSFYGNLWVWTSSYYVPYKNYKPFKISDSNRGATGVEAFDPSKTPEAVPSK